LFSCEIPLPVAHLIPVASDRKGRGNGEAAEIFPSFLPKKKAGIKKADFPQPFKSYFSSQRQWVWGHLFSFPSMINPEILKRSHLKKKRFVSPTTFLRKGFQSGQKCICHLFFLLDLIQVSYLHLDLIWEKYKRGCKRGLVSLQDL